MTLSATLTVAVGAYDNPESLSRALRSVVAQSFRPLRVLVSDDAGERPVSEVVAGFRAEHPDIVWEYHRQPDNLGVARNLVWMFPKVIEDFCIFLQHDDELLDIDFLSDAVRLMESSGSVNVCIGNALIESFDGRDARLLYINNKESLTLDRDWTLFSGEQVAAGILVPLRPLSRLFSMFLRIPPVDFNASWSSLVFRTEAARKTGGFLDSSLISPTREDDLDIYTNEEGFTFLHRLLASGDALMTYRPVSLRGMSPSSFSQLPDHPGRNRKNNLEFFALLKNAEYVEMLNPAVAKLMRQRAKSIGIRVRSRGVIEFCETEVSIRVSPSVALFRGWYVDRMTKLTHHIRKVLVTTASTALSIAKSRGR
jgi:hypothetical protein